MAEKKLTPSDLQKLAEELVKEGKMPTPRNLLKAVAKVREKYAPAIERARKQKA